MKGYFYGWYFKCQNNMQTFAVIPAFHKTNGICTCSIQVITNDGVWSVEFPGTQWKRGKGLLSIGKNRFSKYGIQLSVNTPKLKLKGKLKFSELNPLKYDIMGPFCCVPFMECRHSVFSMHHFVNGMVSINGRKYTFRNDQGYWEGDRGHSFPKNYIWSQCFFIGGSVVLSVAEIPMARRHFMGIISVILWRGKEYRIATYLGAKVKYVGNRTICIGQGELELEVKLLREKKSPLRAPADGSMIRTVHESPSCRTYFCFRNKGSILFEFVSDQASFEYEYPF